MDIDGTMAMETGSTKVEILQETAFTSSTVDYIAGDESSMDSMMESGSATKDQQCLLEMSGFLKHSNDVDLDECSTDSGLGFAPSPARKKLVFSDARKRRSADLDDCRFLKDEIESIFWDCGETSFSISSNGYAFHQDQSSSSTFDKNTNAKRLRTLTDCSTVLQNHSKIWDLIYMDTFSPSSFPDAKFCSKNDLDCLDSSIKENIPPNSPLFENIVCQNGNLFSANCHQNSPPFVENIHEGGNGGSFSEFLEPNAIGNIGSPLLNVQCKGLKRVPAVSSSSSHSVIYRALTQDCGKEEMIGDFTRKCSLPVVLGKHGDLKSIVPDTLAAILSNEYSDIIGRCRIIDCRYPYEFEGGHIQDALNICTKETLLERFFNLDKHHHLASSPKPAKPDIFIFHCEFSSERAPKLMRFLRNHDRAVHKEYYPKLKYPEIYILEGGYKAFYTDHGHHCEPKGYKPMLHKDHAHDLRHFRVKCKSWAGDEKRKGTTLSHRKTLRL